MEENKKLNMDFQNNLKYILTNLENDILKANDLEKISINYKSICRNRIYYFRIRIMFSRLWRKVSYEWYILFNISNWENFDWYENKEW